MKALYLIIFLFLIISCNKNNDAVPQGIDYSLIPLDKAMITDVIPNGGGIGTTDWINPVNGLAMYWGKDYKGISYPSKCVVLCGNGFEGNYQEIENPQQFMLYSCVLDFPNGQYTLSFRYKSTCRVVVCVRTNYVCGYPLDILPPVSTPTFFSKTFTSNVVQVVLYNPISPIPVKSCFDQFNIKKDTI